MYSSYASLKYKMFALDLGHIVLYSTCGYPNPFLSSISLINNNILHTQSLMAIFARDYSFSNSSDDMCLLRVPFPSCVAFSLFFPSPSYFFLFGHTKSAPQWPNPRQLQQCPYFNNILQSVFVSFKRFVYSLCHCSVHLADFVATGLL